MTTIEESRASTETRALRLLRAGDAPKDIAQTTGLTIAEIRQLAIDFPSTATAARCPTPNCGQPQQGAGRPRKGWVQIKPAAAEARWFCAWKCVSRYVSHQLAATKA